MYRDSGDERPAPRMTPAVRAIIALNVAVFFLQVTLSEADITRWLAFTAAAGTTRPWTVITYMFVHAGFWHIFSNLWVLFMFGPRVEEAFGTRRFVFYYLWCGLGGWLAHMLFVSHSGGLEGASAAVLGVMLAYAVRWPDDEVLVFPLPITLRVRWLVAIFAGINLLFGITTAGTGAGVAYFAHLGGLASGAVFLWAMYAPGLDRVRQRVSSVPDEPDEPPRAVPRPPARTRERTSEADDAVARSKASAATRPAPSTPLASRVGKRKTEELDLVLDKISRLGLDSLTPSERKLLEEMSRQLRDR
ncbi:MAG TPA: rhomboid family intramembrane serine protease [Dongiaceae bacterium]|nr:rhomboid family intramembrane serine protease [Dongiaceae bacterium]